MDNFHRVTDSPSLFGRQKRIGHARSGSLHLLLNDEGVTPQGYTVVADTIEGPQNKNAR